MLRLTAFLLATCALLTISAGCGQQNLDETNIEDDVEAELADQGLADPDVVCPDDVVAEKGAEFECLVKATQGTTATIAVRLTGENGEFELSQPAGE